MEPAESEILKQTELKWNKAIEENEVKEMAKFMSEDWIIFSGDGNITEKKQFLQLVISGDLVHTKMDFNILRVKIYGNTGIVMQQGTSAGTWQGLPFSHYEIATTIFMKDNNRWLAVQTMIAPSRTNENRTETTNGN